MEVSDFSYNGFTNLLYVLDFKKGIFLFKLVGNKFQPFEMIHFPST